MTATPEGPALPALDKNQVLKFLADSPDWERFGILPNGLTYWEHVSGAEVVVPAPDRDRRYSRMHLVGAYVHIVAFALGVDRERGVADALVRLAAVLSHHELVAHGLCRCGDPHPCATRTAVLTSSFK